MRLKPCTLCGGEQYELYLGRVYAYEDQVFDLVRCDSCGLVRVAPLPDPETARAFYDRRYFDSDFSCGVRKGSYLETDASRVGEYREILDIIEKYRPSGRLLEVGCAAGSFLNYARRAGYEVEGVDVSEWAAGAAREQFGLNVHVGRLVETGLPDEDFDIVFLGDLLEHEPEPLEFLAEVKRVTKPQGMVVIKVPTYVNSFYYRTARLLPISWTLGRLDVRLLQALKLSREGEPLPPYHLYEYSLDTLSRMLQKSGFRTIDHRTSLLVPEFLGDEEAGVMDRLTHFGFRALRFFVKSFNLPAGHVMVLAVKRKG